MWRPIGTRASVRGDLPGPSNTVVVVLCICVRDSCWLGFVQVCNKFVLGLDLYISRVLVLYYNLERSWFQGLLLSLFTYVEIGRAHV